MPISFPRLRTPRLLIRALTAIFGAVFLVSLALLAVVSVETGRIVSRSVDQSLELSQRMFSAVEQQRLRQVGIQLGGFTENARLLEAFESLRRSHRDGLPLDPEAVAGLQRELERVVGRFALDAVAVIGPDGIILASAGPASAGWAPGNAARIAEALGSNGPSDRIFRRPTGLFRVTTVALTDTEPPAGYLYLATSLNDDLAAELSGLARAQIAIVTSREVVATTFGGDLRRGLERSVSALPDRGTIELAGQYYAARRVLDIGSVRFFALESLGLADFQPMRDARTGLLLIGLGALLLGGGASLWLARTIVRPIDALSQELRQMADARDFSRRVRPLGSSQELDDLTRTFNDLMASLAAAEDQTEQAYVGAIKALAAALDCRDPYTAGHSERVSALAVMIGRQLQLNPDDLDVLRLGALLHDIGKIGIRDNVLTKAGPLTADEFEIIKTHPTLGAHILRQVPFLKPHIPIVEFHHERPDGRGYPHGLLGHATPLLARIVHVADSFDAMTSARAYRPAQTVQHAIGELWRYAGSQFDAEIVEAFVAAWSAAGVGDNRSDVSSVLARSSLVLPFPERLTADARS